MFARVRRGAGDDLNSRLQSLRLADAGDALVITIAFVFAPAMLCGQIILDLIGATGLWDWPFPQCRPDIDVVARGATLLGELDDGLEIEGREPSAHGEHARRPIDDLDHGIGIGVHE